MTSCNSLFFGRLEASPEITSAGVKHKPTIVGLMLRAISKCTVQYLHILHIVSAFTK